MGYSKKKWPILSVHSRPNRWKNLLTTVLLVFIAIGPIVKAQDSRPNIIFILADDLGWGDLRAYGNTDDIKTPNLNRLAREGMRFTQFYVNAPLCSPSRVAFMTGRFPAELGIHSGEGMPNRPLDPNVPTVPDVLKRAGYVTAHFGKFHLTPSGCSGCPRPEEYGLDKYSGATKKDPYYWAKSTEFIVDEVIPFIEANRNKPFYINVWTYLPHSPLNPTEEQLSQYKYLEPSPKLPYKSARQIYYASVTAIDTAIGRLLKKLNEFGLENNTIVLFSSDNGPPSILGEISAGHSGVGSTGPFRGEKSYLTEGGICTPFIVRWPGHVPAGRVDNTSVISAVDLLPTLAKIIGIDSLNDPDLDGEDVSGIIFGTPRIRIKPLLWEKRYLQFSPNLVIRDGNWKFLINSNGSHELYDIPNDPSELQNETLKQSLLVEQLKQKLLDWKATLPK